MFTIILLSPGDGLEPKQVVHQMYDDDVHTHTHMHTHTIYIYIILAEIC